MEQVGVLRRWPVVGGSNAWRSGSREEGRRQGRWRGGWAVGDGIGSAWSRSTRITSIWPVFFAPVLGLGFVSVVAPMGSDGAARLEGAAVRLRRCEGRFGLRCLFLLLAVSISVRRSAVSRLRSVGCGWGCDGGSDLASDRWNAAGAVRHLCSRLRSEPVFLFLFLLFLLVHFYCLHMSFTFSVLLGVVEISQLIRRRANGNQIWTAWRGSNHVLFSMVYLASDLDTSLAYVVASLRNYMANRLWMKMVRLKSSASVFSFIFLVLVWFVKLSHPFLRADNGHRLSLCSIWCVLFYLLVFLNTGGLCPGKCTFRAICALVRRRVPCSVNWSQSPSGRKRSKATGIFQWYLCRKTDRHSKLWLDMSGFVPVCYQNCKANRVANVALFAKWVLLGCMVFVDMPNVLLGCSYNLGFRHYVPPLYSMSLSMVTV